MIYFSLAMEKLWEKFGIERLMLAAAADQSTLLEEGLIDELSLVIAPVSENSSHAVSLFEPFDSDGAAYPVSYRLIEAKPTDGDGLWLRYTPNNRKK